MVLDLSWLVGRCLLSIEKKDYSWFFILDDGSGITSESPWRLIIEKVIVTSEDHGQQFGLPSPVDAAEVVKQSLGQHHVGRFEFSERTGDLSLHFSNGATLQFLTLSGGYEGWRIGHGNQSIICTGVGELAIFNAK